MSHLVLTTSQLLKEILYLTSSHEQSRWFYSIARAIALSHVNSYDYAIGRATVDIGVNPLAITRATLACERTTTRTSI